MAMDEKKLMYVRNCLGPAALLEQLAEECAELCQAALKLARIYRGENPTPVDGDAAFYAVKEEAADVELCLEVVQPCVDLGVKKLMKREKLDRWVERLEERYGEEDAED